MSKSTSKSTKASINTAAWRQRKKMKDQEIIDEFNARRAESSLPEVSLTLTQTRPARGQPRPCYNPPPELMAKMNKEELSKWRAVERGKRKAQKQCENRAKKKAMLQAIKAQMPEFESKLKFQKARNAKYAYNPPDEMMVAMNAEDLKKWRVSERRKRNAAKQRDIRARKKREKMEGGKPGLEVESKVEVEGVQNGKLESVCSNEAVSPETKVMEEARFEVQDDKQKAAKEPTYEVIPDMKEEPSWKEDLQNLSDDELFDMMEEDWLEDPQLKLLDDLKITSPDDLKSDQLELGMNSSTQGHMGGINGTTASTPTESITGFGQLSNYVGFGQESSPVAASVFASATDNVAAGDADNIDDAIADLLDLENVLENNDSTADTVTASDSNDINLDNFKFDIMNEDFSVIGDQYNLHDGEECEGYSIGDFTNIDGHDEDQDEEWVNHPIDASTSIYNKDQGQDHAMVTSPDW